MYTQKTLNNEKNHLIGSNACLLCYWQSLSQTVNGVKISDLKVPYLEFNAYKQSLSSKVLVSLEYGQKVVNDRHAAIVKDDNGKNMEFNSAIDFLNKMKEHGYELSDAYAVSYPDESVSKFYVLKRKE